MAIWVITDISHLSLCGTVVVFTALSSLQPDLKSKTRRCEVRKICST